MNDKTFRYALRGKELKTTCPACGRRRSFSPYADIVTGTPLAPAECGKCDHINSCGYHCSPSEYFRNHPDARQPARHDIAARAAPPEPRPTFIDALTVADSMCADPGGNPLYRYVRGLYAHLPTGDIIRYVFERWSVGTTGHFGGATVFWNIDGSGRVRDGKVMGFDPTTGRRIKTPFPQVNWMTTLMKIPDAHPVRTYFGAQMAWRRPEATLVMVESEKTAVQLAIALRFMLGEGAFDRYVPVAAGGCGGVTARDLDPTRPLLRANVLRRRRLIMVPDRGCRDKWNAVADELRRRAWCASVTVSTVMETPPDGMTAADGDDIEDLIRAALERPSVDPRPRLTALIDALGR